MLTVLQHRRHWVFGALAAVSLPLLFAYDPNPALSLTGLVIATALVGLLSLSPIPLGAGQATLVHSITIPTALALGAREAALALIIGTSLGHAARTMLQRAEPPAPPSGPRPWLRSLGQQSSALIVALLLFRAMGGRIPLDVDPLAWSPGVIGLTLGFIGPYLLLQWLLRTEHEVPISRSPRLAFALIIAFLPLPYAILTAVVLQVLGETSLLILGGVPAVVSPIVGGLMTAERDLERRFEELSTLGEVSQAMRSNLNLDAILHTIYLQVAHVLKVQNFYIALHDPHEATLSYPLAIKAGQREQWPDRAVSDRLTDRVILQGEPILISENAPQALREMGLPELAGAPEAWLGVPLQNPERVLGCLGVFHSEPGRRFSERDLSLLITLAGQASVAIENALLYEETRRRARALSSLNEITAQMSSSLDPEQTLALVSRSLTRVVGGDRAAIYLLDESGTELRLAQSEGLSEAMRSQLHSLPLEMAELTRAYHARSTVMRERLSRSQEIPADLVEQLRSEGIEAGIDMPLITPSGTIGMASVYFNRPLRVEQEQLELLEIFVAQSAIAVANTRAHMVTDQALRRQLEQLSRLETIGRDLVSTLNPDDLFDSLLSSALSATDTRVGHLAVAPEDDEGLHLVAHEGYPEAIELPSTEGAPASAFGLAGRAFRELETLNVGDVRKEPAYVDWSQGRTRSLLAAPILRWGRPIGVLTVESPTVNAFGEEQVRFLSQLTAYAAVAITNARLYGQLEDHLREQSLLYQASAQIATSMDEDTIALAVADSLAVALGAAKVTVFRLDIEEDDLQPLAAAENGRLSRTPASIGRDHAQQLRQCMQSGTVTRFEQDGALLLAVPLQVGAESVGALEIQHGSDSRFSETELRTAQTIASQAAVALQNSQLFRRVRKSRDHLMAVLNSSREGILMIDRAGNIVLANDRLHQYLGLEPAELEDASLANGPAGLWHKLGMRQAQVNRLLDAESAADKEVDETGEILHLEAPQERLLRRVQHPVRDAEGGHLGWLIVLHDVTEEHEIKETRDQLTEMIVHDLRSPLTTIRGSLHLLEQDLPKDNRSQVTSQAINVSNRSVTQLLGLVDSLLDLAQLEGDPLRIQRSEVDVAPLLNNLAEAFVPEANDEGIIINVECARDLPSLSADEEKLRRVLHNLLDNALKFTPEGGRVILKAGAEGDALQLSVTDTGPGIPEDMRDRIFDRFAQVPGQTGRRRGTGLGLAFAKLAVEAHGGSIWVECPEQGGSSFRISLPTGEEMD